MKLMNTFIRKNIGIVLLIVAAICLQIIGTLTVPKLVGKLIDNGVMLQNQTAIKQIGLQMLAAALLGTAAAIFSSYLSALITARFGYQVRQSFFDKFQQLSIKDIESFGSGSLLTRMTNDVDNVQNMILFFWQLIFPAPIICFFALSMTINYSATLAWISLGALLFYGLVVYFLVKKGTPLSLNIQPKMDRITVTLREFFTGIHMIRAFNNQEYEEKRTNETFKNYADSMSRVNKIFTWITPVAFLLMGIVYASLLWFGGNLVARGQLQIGTVTAVSEYSLLTLAYLMIAAMVLVIIPRSIASLSRLQEVLTVDVEIKDAKSATLLPETTGENLVTFENVTFRYNQSAEPVLQKITFNIPKGKTTAVVGATGSGKSSLIKLLLRLHDVSEGTITFAGKELRTLHQTALHNAISYVPQKAFLFSGTILSNLQMGKENATPAEINNAMAIAQLAPFVATLPEGVASFSAQGGSNFSGGQRQRICIARALIKPADLYILDDSFSALDYKTDAALRQALRQEMRHKTLLIVAQRLSTIMHADSIVVLDEGKIVGQGTHQELLKENAFYQDFAKSQGLSGENKKRKDVNP